MYFAYPDSGSLLLYGLIVMAVALTTFGIAIYGTIAGCGAIIIEIEARWWTDRPSKISLQVARQYGWHALIAGGILLGFFAAMVAGLGSDPRLLLIAEPSLLSGGIAIFLARLFSASRWRVLNLPALAALIAIIFISSLKLIAD